MLQDREEKIRPVNPQPFLFDILGSKQEYKERNKKTKGERERCEQVSLEEKEEKLPSTLPSVNHAAVPLPQSTRVVGERREIVGEKERELGVLALGCNEVLCVFLSFALSLSPFKKWNCKGNEYVHKQSQFWGNGTCGGHEMEIAWVALGGFIGHYVEDIASKNLLDFWWLFKMLVEGGEKGSARKPSNPDREEESAEEEMKITYLQPPLSCPLSLEQGDQAAPGPVSHYGLSLPTYNPPPPVCSGKRNHQGLAQVTPVPARPDLIKARARNLSQKATN
ncbi:hypothetical protein QQF64_027581 [Cirrhinus molitorella]|uniref:Uncharacterized protein n=1 Tax=Cirrhinus molitorella TaxID=172907 RepID=A0ABR3NDD6_9TELE